MIKMNAESLKRLKIDKDNNFMDNENAWSLVRNAQLYKYLQIALGLPRNKSIDKQTLNENKANKRGRLIHADGDY